MTNYLSELNIFFPLLFNIFFYEHLSLHYSGYQVIATNASKDENKTSIAGINATTHISKAYIIHHLNSVFPAEVLALNLDTQSFIHSGNHLVSTDSKSSLAALKKINHKSPTCILNLYHSLLQAKHRSNSIILLWLPGHVGIQADECADFLSKSDSFATATYSSTALEDLKKYPNHLLLLCTQQC